MFNKKGVSDVVTIVLTVMITIAAIAIIWVAVTPLLKERVTTASSCYDVNIVIDDSSGYTCYDRTNNISLVQIKRGSSKENITSYKFIVASEGNSYNYQKDDYLEPNSALVFSLNTTGISSIDRISVIPVVTDGKTEKDCSVVFIDNVKSCALNEQEISELTILQQNERRGPGKGNSNPPINQDPCYGKTIGQQCTDGSWISGNTYSPDSPFSAISSELVVFSNSNQQPNMYSNIQAICSDLSLSDYSNWRVPEKQELMDAYNNLHLSNKGDFITNGYPYVSDYDVSGVVWSLSFNTGNLGQASSSSYYNYNYRCVRTLVI